MRRTILFVLAIGVLAVAFAQSKKGRTSPLGYDDTPVIPGQKWKVHDINRPRPAVVTPGDSYGKPPSDAIVLFDGKDLSKWVNHGKKEKAGQVLPASWKVENGYFEVVGGAGDLVTKEKFGDMQLHIEWASPADADGSSQWRGNSGILIMGRYEVQVLDSFNNPTYADGQAAAIYGWWPPLVNASRGPGQWQSYDIVFEAPTFEAGKVKKKAHVTVFHNNVLVHNRKVIGGPMAHKVVFEYKEHEAEAPLGLQDHDVATRYRNVWVRKLKGYDQQ